MKLIRTLHESINEETSLIIFCENKILYDQTEKSYIFNPKDLNFKEINGPFLAIAKINDRYIYVINIDSKDKILGIFMNPDTTNFIDLINILALFDAESF